MTTPPADRSAPRNAFTDAVGGTIFLSRWLQAPLYIGLIVAQGVYVALFWKELVHLVRDFGHLTEYDIMIIVLGLVDVVMIANLLIMVIIGGYETFVSRLKMDNHPDQPEWLSHVNPNVLKVKLAMSIIGISSVHLLKTFIEVGKPEVALKAEGALTNDQVMWQVIIHTIFILSAIGLAWIDQIGARTQAIAAASHRQQPADAAEAR